MNHLDILILLPVIWFGIRGFRKGLIIALCTFVALVAGAFAGIYLSDALGSWLHSSFGMDPRYASAVAFSIIFILIIVLMNLLGRALEKMIDLVALGIINKIAGAAFGISKALMVMSLLFFVTEKFDAGHHLISDEAKEASLLYKPVAGIAPLVIPLVRTEAEKFQTTEAADQSEPETSPE